MTINDEKEKEKLYRRLLDMQAGNIKYKSYIKRCTKTCYSLAAPEYKDELKGRCDAIMHDTKAIVAKGNSILRFLLRNLFNVDNEALEKYLDEYDEISRETLLYYSNIIDYEDVLPQKQFDTIIESDEMTLRAVSLLDTDRIVRRYLGFENEFWEYLDDPKAERLRHLDSLNSEVIEHMSLVVPIFGEGDNDLIDIIVQVPIVKNKETAMKAVDVYTRAYKYYKMLGQTYEKQSSAEEVAGYVDFLRQRATQYRLKK